MTGSDAVRQNELPAEKTDQFGIKKIGNDRFLLVGRRRNG
jgi:hypothetical protein